MSSLPSLSSDSKGKSFWDKPEGLWGMIIGLPILGLVAYGVVLLVPIILATFLGIIGIIITSVIIASLLALIFTNNPLRQAIVLKYQVGVRKFRSMIINEDPIAIMRLLQAKARKRLEEFSELMNMVGKAKRQTSVAADKYKATLDTLYSQISIARQKGDTESENRYLVRAGQTEKYRDSMSALAGDVGRMTDMLNKAKKVCENIVDDADFEIGNEEIHLNAVKAVDGAWGKLRSIFKGNGSDNELRSEAMRSVADQMSERLGRVDNYMEEFKGVMANMNNMDEVNAETARRKMAEMQQTYAFEPRSTSGVPAAPAPTQATRFVTNNPSPVLPVRTVAPNRASSYVPVSTPAPAPAALPQTRGGIKIERH